MAAGPTPARPRIWRRAWARVPRPSGSGTAATGARRLISSLFYAVVVIALFFVALVAIGWIANNGTDAVKAVWNNPFGDDGNGSSDNDEDEVISVASEKDAAKIFGGDEDDWREAKNSEGFAWTYKGPKTNLLIPEGFRVDYPNHSCVEPKSEKNTGGVYGKETVKNIKLATVWDVSAEGETQCPATSKFVLETVTPTPKSQATPPTAGATPTGASSFWGPAGEAPQNIDDAARILGVEKQFLTKHNYKPGDDTVIGWVIGTNGTEAVGMRIHANNIPNGTCVDLDPGASSITNKVAHVQVFTPMWSRTLTDSDGSFDGLKSTVYWTPCVFTDGFKTVVGTVKTGSNKDNAAFSCTNLPKSKEDLVKIFPDSKNGAWGPTNFPHGWMFTTSGAPISLKAVEGIHHIDYDGGTTMSGQTTPSGTVFTVWFCK